MKLDPLIKSYHVHIYYDLPTDYNEGTRHIAEELHKFFNSYRILQKRGALDSVSDIKVGRMHDRPIGPHTKPMFVLEIHHADFDTIIPYLMLNRRGLSVLVHPETGNDLKDHTEHPVWMGVQVPLDTTKL